MKSVCIKCGNIKSAPYKKCRKCNFLPRGVDLVKSVYCSTGRFPDDSDEVFKYESELDEISAKIKNGIDVGYDPAELQRLSKEEASVREIGWGKVLLVLFLIFRPIIIFLLVFYGLIAILKVYF